MRRLPALILAPFALAVVAVAYLLWPAIFITLAYFIFGPDSAWFALVVLIFVVRAGVHLWALRSAVSKAKTTRRHTVRRRRTTTRTRRTTTRRPSGRRRRRSVSR